MKLKESKFAIALGVAFALSFLLCNLIFLVGGDDFSLGIMNSIFHNTDFKSIMIDTGFNAGKLLVGMGTLFVAGSFVGYFTAFIYNMGKRKESM